MTSLSTSKRRRRREGFSSSDDLSAVPELVTPGVMSDRFELSTGAEGPARPGQHRDVQVFITLARLGRASGRPRL